MEDSIPFVFKYSGLSPKRNAATRLEKTPSRFWNDFLIIQLSASLTCDELSVHPSENSRPIVLVRPTQRLRCMVSHNLRNKCALLRLHCSLKKEESDPQVTYFIS